MSFDLVAPYYDRLARLVFGGSIRRAQCHFLDQLPSRAHVLVVGGGTGWLLPHLLAKPAVTHITYLETSAAMLALAQQKMEHVSQPTNTSIEFILGDERHLPQERHFSVIITNFVLDMYQGVALDHLMRTLAAHLLPGGIWLFTDFRLSDQRRHRWWQQLATQAMYLFFHVTAGIARQPLPPYHRHFIASNFRKTHEKSFFADFIVSRVYCQEG